MNHTTVPIMSYMFILLCIHTVVYHTVIPCIIVPYQVGEVVSSLSTHDSQWVAESRDIVDVGVEGLGAGVDDHEDEGGNKLIGTGRTILGDPQGSCIMKRERGREGGREGGRKGGGE